MADMVCELVVTPNRSYKGKSEDFWRHVGGNVWSRVAGVKSVDVDPSQGKVIITGRLDGQAIVDAISRVGAHVTVNRLEPNVIVEAQSQPEVQPQPEAQLEAQPHPEAQPESPPMPNAYPPVARNPWYRGAWGHVQHLAIADKLDNITYKTTSKRVEVTFRNQSQQGSVLGSGPSNPGSQRMLNVEIQDGHGQPEQVHNAGYDYGYSRQQHQPPPPSYGNPPYWPNMADDNVDGSCSIF